MRLFLAATLLLFLGSGVHAEEPKRKALDVIFSEGNLWARSLEDIKTSLEPKPASKSAGKPGNKKAPNKKITTSNKKSASPGPFEWLSDQKLGIRAPGKKLTFLGKDIGEVVIRTKGETASDVTISIYNRGDDETMRKSDFGTTMDAWRSLINERLQVRPEDRSQTGRIEIDGTMWRKGDTAWLLEGSMTRRENRVEFIRLRMASLSAPKKNDGKLARRDSLDENVTKDKNGDVYVKGIPMVDQGEKGYCVVATVERVARYFGADVDQHELAGLANTGAGGTTNEDMIKAFQRLTGQIHVRTIKLIDYDEKQLKKDFASYNRLAKREGVWHSEIDLDDYYMVDPRWFWANADKNVFKSIKAKQTKFAHFNRKIKEFVDEGVPLCWTLYLGMFPEKGLPQTYGGHMRLIIGYNELTREIIYTDSWGKGHSFKRMPADEAWCMSMGLYSMVPNR